ncbi:Conidial surface nicotinamide adenine<br_dinucleotide glycohydrolase nadA [Botrytis cinerea]
MKLQLAFLVGVIAISNASPHPTSVKGRHFDEPGNPDQPDQPYGCNCTGTTPGPLPSSAQYICYDWRLGPKTLPKYLPLSSELSSYDRFDGLTPGEFIKTWWDPELNPPYGSFRYPGDVTPGDQGFSIDINGKPISGFVELPPNTYLDRFGKETGMFLSSADTPYSQRSLPPSNLNNRPDDPGFPNDYHVYRTTQKLILNAGPIAPWFGQPGLGTQFYSGPRTIADLIGNKTLERVDPSVLISNRQQQGCGY